MSPILEEMITLAEIKLAKSKARQKQQTNFTH